MAESSSELQVQLWSDVSWVTAGGVTVTVAVVVVVVKAVVVAERYEDTGEHTLTMKLYNYKSRKEPRRESRDYWNNSSVPSKRIMNYTIKLNEFHIN